MSVIYGIRVLGSPEIRYVGQTSRAPEVRMRQLRSLALAAPRKGEFDRWLIDNNIEVVVLDVVEAGSANIAERATVRLCLAMGHRLFNQWLVPAEKRIGPRPSYSRELRVQWAAARVEEARSHPTDRAPASPQEEAA